MTSNAFLIRTSRGSDRVNLVVDNFKKNNIFNYLIVEERYHDQSCKTHLKDNNHLIIGPDYLKKNNLANFPKVGWQCGDYIAYAGYDFLQKHDYYWVLDDDLYLNLDINDFLRKTNELTIDCLATNFGKRGHKWAWYASLSHSFSNIYGMRYPLVRLSNNAVKFLKEKRSDYHPNIQPNQYGKLFANDEVFTGTYLFNNGFSCSSIQDEFPNHFSNEIFSLTRPVLVHELSENHTKNQIIHPVCDIDRFKSRVTPLINENDTLDLPHIIYRLYCTLGEKITYEYLNMSCLEILNKIFKTESIVNLREVSNLIDDIDLPTIKRKWFYNDFCYVLDFNFNNTAFALDINVNGDIYIVPRNNRAEMLVKTLFRNDGKKTCVVKRKDFVHKKLATRLEDSHVDNIAKIALFIQKHIES